MIIFEDGSFYTDEGEIIPFTCPKCDWPQEWKDVEELTCKKCKFKGTAEEFSHNLERVEPN